MTKSLLLLSALAFLTGCQSLSSSDNADNIPVQDENLETKAPERVYGTFTEQSVYQLLAAELAGQRNRFDIALNNYMHQAQQTRDAGVAERAFRIAEYLGADQQALESALIWADTAPDNIDAQRAAAVQLARAQRYDEAMAYMESVLQHQGSTHFDFLALSAADTDPDTRAGLLQSFDRLLSKYPDNSQLIFGKAVLLQQDNRSKEALTLLEEHPASNRDVSPILLRTRLLQNLGRTSEALPLLERGIKVNPDDKRLRLTYARLLVEQDRLDDAKGEFATLLQQNPNDDDLRFSLALVCLEAGAWDEAIVYLQELIDRRSHLDAAHYNLGRALEELSHPIEAISAYAEVGPGNEYLPAQQRRATLLARAGDYLQLNVLLERARREQPDYAIGLFLIEAEALSNHNQIDSAWNTVETALKLYPDDLSLLYTRAMLAEKRDNLAQLETDLRAILEREPEHAMAINALGYTLADRTTRYAEARELIEKAHQLSPDDPAILDSMGWVRFRQGDLNGAEQYLRQAYNQYPDAEVAAHLGEVLWTQGNQREAREIWRAAQDGAPDNQVLRSTLKRLLGSEAL